MKIWITGGAGFVGTRLTTALKQEGHEVVSLSRRHAPLASESITVDLATSDSVDRIKAGIKKSGSPEVVINAASRQPGSGTLAEFVRANSVATVHLIEGLQSSPPQRVIHLSTLSVYHHSNPLPVNEENPATASTHYAMSKRLGEQVVENVYGSQVVILRLPSLYGAGQADSFIDGLARTAQSNRPLELFSEGKVIRDALHVSDVVAAIQVAMQSRLSERVCVMNLGCGRAIRTLEFATTVVDVFESTSEIVPVTKAASQPDLYADISKAEKLIGFRPTELRESLKRYRDELRT